MAENLAIDDGGEGIHYNQSTNEHYYTWDAAMRIANSIPGWHLPSTTEWNEAALACGAMEIPYKNSAYNDYKCVEELKDTLCVKPDGFFYGYFGNIGASAFFRTSTEYDSSHAYVRQFINVDNGLLSSITTSKENGYSVRLVKDNVNDMEERETSGPQIKKLDEGKTDSEGAATANAGMHNVYDKERQLYMRRIEELKSEVRELKTETKRMEFLERANKILDEQNLAYKKLLDTKDAEIAEIRRSTDFYKNYYLEDKEVHRPAMRKEIRALKEKIRGMEG